MYNIFAHTPLHEFGGILIRSIQNRIQRCDRRLICEYWLIALLGLCIRVRAKKLLTPCRERKFLLLIFFYVRIIVLLSVSQWNDLRLCWARKISTRDFCFSSNHMAMCRYWVLWFMRVSNLAYFFRGNITKQTLLKHSFRMIICDLMDSNQIFSIQRFLQWLFLPHWQRFLVGKSGSKQTHENSKNDKGVRWWIKAGTRALNSRGRRTNKSEQAPVCFQFQCRFKVSWVKRWAKLKRLHKLEHARQTPSGQEERMQWAIPISFSVYNENTIKSIICSRNVDNSWWNTTRLQVLRRRDDFQGEILPSPRVSGLGAMPKSV